MAEYIEREAAIAALPVAWDSAVDALRYAPAADVAPVVHAKWIPMGGMKRDDRARCSNCRKPRPNKSKYCPNCGAKMDGGTEK